MRWCGWCLLAAAMMVLGTRAAAFEQRSGTFSIGIQGQVSGLLSGKGDYDAFRLRNGLEGLGAGLSVRLRLAVDRASAVGINFEAIDFKRSLGDDEIAPFEEAANDTSDKVHSTVVTLDYYRYFWRRMKDTPYVVAGVGYYRPEIRFGEFGTRFPGSNAIAHVGVGGEHFFTRSVSLELSARMYALFHSGGPSTASQLAIGIRFYHLGRRRR